MSATVQALVRLRVDFIAAQNRALAAAREPITIENHRLGHEATSTVHAAYRDIARQCEAYAKETGELIADAVAHETAGAS